MTNWFDEGAPPIVRRSGTVAVVGRPNAGKSTLVNALVGRKVAIVSDKPQTTRRNILGIRTSPEGQIVFVDTPGLHKPLHKLNKRMMDEALEAIREVDLRLLVIDVSVPSGGGDRFTIDLMRQSGRPRVVVLNKIDQIDKVKLLPRLAELGALGIFDEIVPVSALVGDGVAQLPGILLPYLPEGDELYPAETITTTDPKIHYAEVIREKFLERTREEIPYGLGVVIDEMGRDEAKNLSIVMATIYVDKENHRRIVLGTGGKLIRDAGTAARLELEAQFGGRFFLDLNVKAYPGWREDPRFLSELTS
jgi:GTP-binding protein Era